MFQMNMLCEPGCFVRDIFYKLRFAVSFAHM